MGFIVTAMRLGGEGRAVGAGRSDAEVAEAVPGR